MKRSIILLGAALFLAACDMTSTADGPRAGGEDFPNAVNALGRTLALGMDSTQDWNGLDSASTDVGTGGSALKDSVPSFAGRSFGLCMEDSSTTILDNGRASFQKTTCLPGTLVGSVHDSIVMAYYAGLTEKSIDTVYWWSSDSLRVGYQSYTSFQPYSRSYVLLKGDTGKALYNVRRKAGRWTDYATMLADGGRDHMLGTDGDNTFWSMSRALVKDASTASFDTAWAWWVEPAVAGQPIIGTTDSGLARTTKLDKFPMGRRIESGLLMAHRVDSLNYAQLWSARTDWNSGLTRWQTVFGSHSDSSFRARETVHLLDRFRHSGKLDSTRIEATAILGPSLARHDKDSMLSVRYERYRSNLVERHTIWQIQSDSPVVNGSESKSGTIFARVEFADTSYAHAAYAQFHGRWDTDAFVGTWSNGKDSATIRVARNGVVLSSTKL